MLNRRRFVYGVVSAAVLAPTLSGKASIARGTTSPSLQGRLSRDVFLALRQQTFTVVIDQRRVRLVLAEVTDDGRAPGLEQFTVRFEGPRDLRLGDGTWTFHHPRAGHTPLYAQPAGADGRASYYNVTFNLLS
jgi:hypothetical protein